MKFLIWVVYVFFQSKQRLIFLKLFKQDFTMAFSQRSAGIGIAAKFVTTSSFAKLPRPGDSLGTFAVF